MKFQEACPITVNRPYTQKKIKNVMKNLATDRKDGSLMAKIICVDFDGTIVEHSFPEIGKEILGAFETLRDLKTFGYKLILWTCREDEGYLIARQFLKDAVEFCRENGVEFDAVNETILEEDFRDKCSPHRKPYAHYYVDDRNLGGFPGWDVVRKVLLEDRKLEWRVKDEQ